jgi:hypothetical protein
LASLGAVCLIAIIIKSNIHDSITFDTDTVQTYHKLGAITLKICTYSYADIYKFLFGSYYNRYEKYYILYADIHNTLVKIKNITTYQECMSLMEQIKNRAHKSYYDGTSSAVYFEEDLFMNYYKTKQLVLEVKQEEGGKK